ncbi:MAG: hypothetical protein ACYS7Y_16595 [Planctomycetota bacterium]|jgi:hypothetical protein
MPREELQVFSHQRSGTHLLLEKDLFLVVGNGKNRIYSDGKTIKKGKNIKVKGGKLISSHKLPGLCEWSEKNAIYICRDGFDVLFSFYKLRTYKKKGKPRFDQWLTTERIEHWACHVKGKKHWSMEKRAILAELKEKYGLE